MTRLVMAALTLSMCVLFAPGLLKAAGPPTQPVACPANASAGLPKRPRRARTASALMADMRAIGGTERDRMVAEQVLAGNIPGFMRRFVPVTLHGTAPRHGRVEVTICVTPDYLALGEDTDFVRVPLGLPAAAAIADRLGYPGRSALVHRDEMAI